MSFVISLYSFLIVSIWVFSLLFFKDWHSLSALFVFCFEESTPWFHFFYCNSTDFSSHLNTFLPYTNFVFDCSCICRALCVLLGYLFGLICFCDMGIHNFIVSYNCLPCLPEFQAFILALLFSFTSLFPWFLL